MNEFQRLIIAVGLGVGMTIGLQWLFGQMGYTEEQIHSAGGIPLVVAGAVTTLLFLKLTEKRKPEENDNEKKDE